MTVVLRSFASGPLGPYVSGFAQELVRQGYTINGGEQHLRFLAHLNRWMVAEGLSVADLCGPTLERYLSQRGAEGYVRYRSMKAMRPLLGYLAQLGVLPSEDRRERGPVQDLLGRYLQFLVLERGLGRRGRVLPRAQQNQGRQRRHRRRRVNAGPLSGRGRRPGDR